MPQYPMVWSDDTQPSLMTDGLPMRRAGAHWPNLRSKQSMVSTTVRDLYTTPMSIICRVLKCGSREIGDSRSSITPFSLR